MIGHRIKSLRNARRLYAFELADRAGLARSVVSKVETGKTKPEQSTINKLAQELGVTVAELERTE